MQALYQMDMAHTDLNAIIEEFTHFRLQGRDEADDGQAVALASADQTYFAELVRGAVRRQREIDPMVWVPSASGHRPAATAAAEPLLDPPGVCARSCGLRVGPGAK